jgi:hypothetical protein
VSPEDQDAGYQRKQADQVEAGQEELGRLVEKDLRDEEYGGHIEERKAPNYRQCPSETPEHRHGESLVSGSTTTEGGPRGRLVTNPTPCPTAQVTVDRENPALIELGAQANCYRSLNDPRSRASTAH